MSTAAQRLAEGDLQARVGAHGSDEIGRLAAVFDEMAERLEQAFHRERALEASRRELISAVSHDLRTPLATTRAMVEALADGVVTDKDDVQRYLGLILQETQHLSRLIDDLFELSQIDSGALRLRCMPIDVAELVAETVAAYQAPGGRARGTSRRSRGRRRTGRGLTRNAYNACCAICWTTRCATRRRVAPSKCGPARTTTRPGQRQR